MAKATRFDKSDKLLYGGDLSKYGKDFQIKLMSLLIKDRIFSFSIIPILNDEYFTDIWLRNIYTVIKEYIAKYNNCPTIDNIKILLQDKEENLITYKSILQNIEEVSLEDRDFVIDNSRKFCFTKHRLIEIEKEKILLEQGNFESAQKISIESYKHSGLGQKVMYDLKEDYEKIFQDDVLHRPVETPFPTINKCSKGGPGAGNLIIDVAFSNFGKTSALIAYARHANQQGKNVAFFSYEIGGIDIIRKYIAGQIGIKQEDLKYNKQKIKDALIDSTLGNFRLVEERATAATIPQLKNNLEYLKSTGFYPDLICVDSLNQLKITGDERWRMKDDNQKFEFLAEELRDLACEEGFPIRTVFQSNRCLEISTKVDIKNKGKIEIKDVKLNDEILTQEGYKKIINVYEKEKQPVYKIKLKNGMEILCSSKHEFPTGDNKLLNIENGLEPFFKLLIKK